MSSAFVDVDLHGLTADQAQVEIDRVLRRLSPSVYQVRLTHGYHGGTAIRSMIQYCYRRHPKVRRIMPGDNPGVTILVIREL